MDGHSIIDTKPHESADHEDCRIDVKPFRGDETKVQDEFQAPTTPQDNEPSSDSHSTPGQQTSQTPGTIAGLAPIYPYIPHAYYTLPMQGFLAPAVPAAGDPFLTGSVTEPISYRDASNLNDPIPDTRRNRGGVTEPFPEKLHQMLEQTETEGLADVVSFLQHGRAFAIHKPRRFAEEIMPRFFKQTRLTSFQRQLNLYGFRRISHGPDNGAYYHELFLKGRPGLCVNMKRTKIRGSQKVKRDQHTDPNFYALPPINVVQQGLPMMTSPGFAPSQQQALPGGHPIDGSQPPVAYPHAGMPFPAYPGMVTAPYTAAQQQVSGALPASVVYGYPAPYYPPYVGWGYPMAAMAQHGQMPATSPVQTSMASNGGNIDDHGEEPHVGLPQTESV